MATTRNSKKKLEAEVKQVKETLGRQAQVMEEILAKISALDPRSFHRKHRVATRQ